MRDTTGLVHVGGHLCGLPVSNPYPAAIGSRLTAAAHTIEPQLP